MAIKKSAKSRAWIVASRDLVAEFFSVTDRTVATWIGQGMPRVEVKPSRYSYDLKAIYQWRKEQEEKKEEDDLDGEDDPELLALKKAKLKQEVRIKTADADKLENLVVPREEAHECMQQFAHRLRSLGELYKRQNPSALGPLNQALEDCERILSPITHDSEPATDTTEDEESANGSE